MADGAYDQTGVTAALAERVPGAAVIVPRLARAVWSVTAETKPAQRDQHLQLIAEHDWMAWQKASRYHACALVEALSSRWECVLGDGLCIRSEDRRNADIAFAVQVLNHTLDLGRPDSDRIA